MRGLLNFSSKKLPKQAFRARRPQLFRQEASKTSISCEVSSTFQATSFQNEHFVRGLLNFSSKIVQKRAFRPRHPPLFRQEASETGISCEASTTFQATSFQNEHFLRGLLNFSSEKLPKQAFRARPQRFKQRSFQNEHFARGFPNFSSKKLPKCCACHAKRENDFSP